MDVIDRRPVEAPFAGRILTTRTKLVGVACETAPSVLSVVGTFTAILAFRFGLEVRPPAGARPPLAPAVASLLVGLGVALLAFSLYSLYWTIQNRWLLFDWYVRRVARRQIASRPDRLGDPDDPQAAFVEIVPREEWGRALQPKPADVGFLWIDAARREVLFEGDREQIRIPAAGILNCRVFHAPFRINGLLFQKFFFVVSCVHPTDLIEISFAHGDGFGMLGAARRRQRAVSSGERILSLIALQPAARAADTERRSRLHADADAAHAPRDANRLGEVSTHELMDRCDTYWEWLGQLQAETSSRVDAKSRYGEYVAAINELASRGPDIIDWATVRLTHAEFDVREQAAFLLGEVAAQHPLGSQLDAIVAALSKLATRPVSDDGKEAQANTAAVIALGKIGDRQGIAALGHVLTSEEWADDDIQWDAAEALGRILDEPFVEADEPILAAREWLTAHPQM